jgi:hypothetical protein
MPLTDTAVKNAKPKSKPYKLSDMNGMYLLVTPKGARLWRYKYRIAGKEGLFAIGEYPAVSLANPHLAIARTAVLGSAHLSAEDARLVPEANPVQALRMP